MRYRKKHPGPRSNRSYKLWKRLGGKDREGFKWEKKRGKFQKNRKNGVKSVTQTVAKGRVFLKVTYH